MTQQQQRPQALTVPHDEPVQTPRCPWHQPRLERLHVSLDTASEAGSGSDLGNQTDVTTGT